MLGDNGVISRASDAWEVLEYTLLASSFGDQAPRHYLSEVEGSRAGREVRMIDPVPGVIAGSDLIFGGPGEDDMYGQFDDSGGLDPQSGLIVGATIGDELYGEEGEDAMLGDNGVIENRVLGEPTQEIASKQPFFDDERFVQGSLLREVSLAFADTGGHDRLLGGPSGDWMHGGAGNDLMNGNPGNDRLFGDDGDDVLWGGFDHDHAYGGRGKDYLDVKPRPEMTVGKKNQQMTLPPDLVEWFAFGEDANHQDNYEGIDYIYGGWGQDAMQADEGDHGPVPGDRLIDWVGAYNVYYVCPALYGGSLITRAHGPAIVEFLQQLAEGDGAIEPANQGSSGFDEVAIVFAKEANYNSHPVHDDNPGHFTCVQPSPPDLAIEATDGHNSVTPGQILTYVLTVSNRGALDATGVAIRDTLPADTTFSAASDSGSYADGVVTWPAVSLAVGSSLSRTVTVQLADPLPSGLEVLTNTASVADDGTHGSDLWTEDNTATDADTVVETLESGNTHMACSVPVDPGATEAVVLQGNLPLPSCVTAIEVTIPAGAFEVKALVEFVQGWSDVEDWQGLRFARSHFTLAADDEDGNPIHPVVPLLLTLQYDSSCLGGLNENGLHLRYRADPPGWDTDGIASTPDASRDMLIGSLSDVGEFAMFESAAVEKTRTYLPLIPN